MILFILLYYKVKPRQHTTGCDICCVFVCIVMRGAVSARV